MGHFIFINNLDMLAVSISQGNPVGVMKLYVAFLIVFWICLVRKS